jgi:hypothetical protein
MGRHAANRLVEGMPSIRNFEITVGRVEDAEGPAGAGDVGRDRVGPETVAGGRVDNRPGDVPVAPVADIEADAPLARRPTSGSTRPASSSRLCGGGEYTCVTMSPG